MLVILKQKVTQNTNHYLWFVIASQNTLLILKRAHLAVSLRTSIARSLFQLSAQTNVRSA
jgi:hypothetical protein